VRTRLDYLTDIFRRLPTAKIGDIQNLLPANWKPLTANASWGMVRFCSAYPKMYQ